MSPAELKVMALRAEVEQHKRQAKQFQREVRLYRENLEKALGKVIAGQRKETDALRDEIAKLRADLEASNARRCRHAVSAPLGAVAKDNRPCHQRLKAAPT